MSNPRMHKIDRLQHGGIMTNYQCNAACRHCLYACSPERSGGYIKPEMADKICRQLSEAGCHSVHIGGGEPFLDIGGLVMVLETARKYGITVEYVETNAFWAADEELAVEYLRAISMIGAGAQATWAGNQVTGPSKARSARPGAQAERPALCISLDPFHAEYVPAALPVKLAEICRNQGFDYFLWQDKYRAMLSRLHAADKVQSRAELERQLSPDYIQETAQAYGLRMGGRALSIEAEYGTPRPVAEILGASSVTQKKPCRNLLSAGHFHVDLYGRYIPPGCTGIVLPLEEAVDGVPCGKYPAFDALVAGGVAALFELATAEGFKPEAAYTSGCALCFHIRRYLSAQAGFTELDAEHYVASLRYC